jgi:hypothetical protein
MTMKLDSQKAHKPKGSSVHFCRSWHGQLSKKDSQSFTENEQLCKAPRGHQVPVLATLNPSWSWGTESSLGPGRSRSHGGEERNQGGPWMLPLLMAGLS